MKICNAKNVRTFMLGLYADKLTLAGIGPETVKDDFDLLNQGIIDSLGVLELVSTIEEEFSVTVDLEGLDAEQLTIVGPLCEYIGRTALSKGAAPVVSPSDE